MDDIAIISRVSLPDISVELRTVGVLGLGGLGSFDDCSTKNESESLGSEKNVRNIFNFNDGENAAE